MPAPAAAVPVRDAHGTDRCPSCSSALVGYDDHEPWCPQCEWNLDAYRPLFEREGVLGSLNRRVHAIGYRQGPQIVQELAGHEVPRPAATASSRTLIVISVVLYVVLAALLLGGAWLVSRLQPLQFLIGAVMLGFAWALRPRLGTRRRALKFTWKVDRQTTPALFEMLDRIAAAVGGRTPDTVAFGLHWNLFIASVGLRRRSVLVIGLPMFVTAQPQERIAMLAHEIGHQVNGDVRRGLLTQPALTVFGRLASMFWWPLHEFPLYYHVALLARLISCPMYACHIGLNLLGSREARRAEHYADALSARVAGTRAAQEALDLSVFGDDMEKLIDGIAIRSGDWRTTVDKARERWSAQLDARRQLTIRTQASALADHPPLALRYRLLGSTPYHDPAVALTDAEAQRLDPELHGYVIAYDRFLRQLAGPAAG